MQVNLTPTSNHYTPQYPQTLYHYKSIIFQAILSLALVAAATAAPQYAAKPVVAYAADDLAEPSPYTYTYAVADDYSNANFQQTESNDGTGAVSGSYSVNLPDGRIQTVTYNANDITGNVAEVTYSGEAQYPTAPAGGYVAAAPVHAVYNAPVVHSVRTLPVVHTVHASPVAHAVHATPVIHAAPFHAVRTIAHPVIGHHLG